jgi:hypothetical protein
MEDAKKGLLFLQSVTINIPSKENSKVSSTQQVYARDQPRNTKQHIK